VLAVCERLGFRSVLLICKLRNIRLHTRRRGSEAAETAAVEAINLAVSTTLSTTALTQRVADAVAHKATAVQGSIQCIRSCSGLSHSPPRTGAKAEAWCLLIHADAYFPHTLRLHRVRCRRAILAHHRGTRPLLSPSSLLSLISPLSLPCSLPCSLPSALCSLLSRLSVAPMVTCGTPVPGRRHRWMRSSPFYPICHSTRSNITPSTSDGCHPTQITPFGSPCGRTPSRGRRSRWGRFSWCTLGR